MSRAFAFTLLRLAPKTPRFLKTSLVFYLAIHLIVLFPTHSRADGGQGKWIFGVAPCYAFVTRDDKSEPDGGGVSIFLGYGITEAIDIGVSALWTGHDIEATGNQKDTSGEGGLYQIINIAIAGRYAFDLLSFAPAFEIGFGVIRRSYKESSEIDSSIYFGVGVDYWILSWLSLGAGFHYHAFLVTPTQYPIYFDVGPRFAVRWP